MMKESVLHLKSLNHISLVCRSVEKSLDFYQSVLGFFPVRRPGSFDFNGAWLFNYGIGMHLLQSEDPDKIPEKITQINPKDNHISFQTDEACTRKGMCFLVCQKKPSRWFFNLRHTLQSGIGLHHAGLNDKDRSLVEELFANNKIQAFLFDLSKQRVRRIMEGNRRMGMIESRRRFRIIRSWDQVGFRYRMGPGHISTRRV
ncbi:unnamed protein product [Prunus armeniaca]